VLEVTTVRRPSFTNNLLVSASLKRVAGCRTTSTCLSRTALTRARAHVARCRWRSTVCAVQLPSRHAQHRRDNQLRDVNRS